MSRLNPNDQAAAGNAGPAAMQTAKASMTAAAVAALTRDPAAVQMAEAALANLEALMVPTSGRNQSKSK